MELKRIALYVLPIITFVIGIIIPVDILPPKLVTFHEDRDPGQYRFTNPLLDCDAANFTQDAHFFGLKNKINDVIKQDTDKGDISFASVYFRDLNDGPWIGINEKEQFSPASLIKVPTLMTYYKMAEKDPSILKQPLTYQPTVTPETQNIPPTTTLAAGQTYTIEQLLHNMIVYSDNEAYNLLNNNVDSSQIIKTYNDLGINIQKGLDDPTGNIISVLQYSSFFRVLYNSSYLSKDYSEKALELLSQVDFKKGLVAGVNNPNVQIAHKFGERNYTDTGEKQLHDCGIVYSKNPYLLCVMTRGNDFDKLSSSIADISRTVYSTLNN